MKQLAAIQFVGNAAALYLGYYWLSIGEARAGLLAWSFTVALVTAALFLWMHGAGVVHGRDPHSAPFRAALRHLPALFAAAIVAVLIYVAVGKLQDACNTPAFRLASWLTLKLRKPVKPAAVMRVVSGIFWVVRWIVIPVLLMPWISAVASLGWRGFKPGYWTRFTSRERGLAVLLLLCALWLPFLVMRWHPLMSSFTLEMTSFVVRALVAYLLFAGGLFALEGMPLFTQRRSAVSP